MPHDFYALGTESPTTTVQSNPMALQTLTAIERSTAFVHIKNASYDCASKGMATVIVVDCLNDNVPSRNQYGIKNRERLALVFYNRNEIGPETRALRKDFPTGLHQNAVNDNEPISLCLYDEPWTSTKRHWTAETHLKQILWWLKTAATGELHQIDQPLEPFFYSSGSKLVLPPDFNERIDQKNCPTLLLFGNDASILAIWESDVNITELPEKMHIRTLVLNLSPLQHANIERLPLILGRLQDILQARGSNLFPYLKDAILATVPPCGVTKKSDHTLLVLNIPLTRNSGSSVERLHTVAFLIKFDICALGKALGVLNYDRDQKKYFKLVLLGEEQFSVPTDWRTTELAPVDIVISNSRHTAQVFSGIDSEKANFAGVLAGVGSLGGTLAEIWASEGWGHWTYIDHDRVEAHNIARHTAKYLDIGCHKVHQVAESTANNYYPGCFKPKGIPDSAINFSNLEISKALSKSDLIIDASTTLEVPRELALQNGIARSISVFFTPNCQDSVMLAEDKDRNIRLDSLEAQYYRTILNNNWGKSHLDKHNGDIWIGHGCRDISTVIPTDLVQLHSALLARRIRQTRDQDCAKITVFSFNDSDGVAIHEIEPKACTVFHMEEWSIIIDKEVKNTLIKLRIEKLPRETGGIILGYIDQATHRIYVVNVLDAPFDSTESCSSFVRGTKGLLDILKETSRRTAGIVTYLGEWHSHPPKCGAMPSCLDISLLDYLGSQLATDGRPALMAIVGEKEISFMLRSDL